MAARFWVNDDVDGLWNNANNWATTSGGVGGAGIPTSSDDVTFDSLETANCTISTTNATCSSLTLSSGYTGTITLNVSMLSAENRSTTISDGTIVISSGNFYIGDPGTLTINSGGTVTVNSTMLCQNGGTIIVNSGGTLDGTGYIRGQRNQTISGVIGCEYRIDNNQAGKTTTLGGDTSFLSDLSNMGASSHTVSTANYDVTFQGDVDLDSTITWSKGTGTITFSGSVNQSVDFDSETIEDIAIDKTAGKVTLTAGLTTDSVTITDGELDRNSQTLTCSGNWTQSAGTQVSNTGGTGSITISGIFDINGVSGNVCSWEGDVVVNGASADADYTSISNSTATGTASPIDATTECVDGGSNSGWTFGTAPVGILNKYSEDQSDFISYTSHTLSITKATVNSILLVGINIAQGGTEGTVSCTDNTSDSWTKLHDNSYDTSAPVTLAVFSKVADGDETSVTVSWTNAGASQLVIYELTGLDSASATPDAEGSDTTEDTFITSATPTATPSTQPGFAVTFLGSRDYNDWGTSQTSIDDSYTKDFSFESIAALRGAFHSAYKAYSVTSEQNPTWSTSDTGGDYAEAWLGLWQEASGGGGVTLIVQDALHSVSAENVALTQAHVLTVQDASHAVSAEGDLPLSQANTLSITDALHATSVDNIALQVGLTLVVSESLHPHVVDSLNLIQAHVLVVAGSAHAHTVDNVVLSSGIQLSVAGAAHDQSAENVDLVQAHTLQVQDTAHAASADNVDLVQANTLSVAEALHAVTVDSPALDISATLTVADSLHTASADGDLALTQAYVLAVQEALHAASAGNIDLSQGVSLIVSDALHAALSENLSLVIPGQETALSHVFLVPAAVRVFRVS